MSFEEMYDILEEVVDVSKESLDLVFGINGCNTETAEAILYYYTGWNSFEGFMEEID